MTVALIDYGSGNLHSALKAISRMAGSETVIRTSDPDEVRKADRIVLPGVGAFGDCKRGLAATPGLIDALREVAIDRGRPFLGICVGMQLLATRGLEHGETAGLGWIDGEVVELAPSDPSLKIPHMGWNNLRAARPHALLDGLPASESGRHAYFVHSFHFVARDPGDVLAHVDYGGDVVAMIARGNIVGTQFHPEKSQRVGLALIEKFLRWTP